MKFTEKIIAHFERPYSNEGALRLFSRLVYGWLLLFALSLWSERQLLWGNESVLLRSGQGEGFLFNMAYLLVYKPSWFGYVYYPHILFAVFSIVENRCSFIFRLLTWITGLLLYYSAYSVFNSSYLLMLLMALYMAFVNTNRHTEFQMILNRVAAYTAMAQVMLVYLVSGISKCAGEMWQKGEALYYTLRIERFSWPVIIDSTFVQNITLMKSLNFFILLFQLCFPILILTNRFKRAILVIGIAMHILIGMIMHLWDFATAMLLCYVLFLKKK